MSGTAKPDIPKLGREIIPAIISSYNISFGGINGLFDGLYSPVTSSSAYWIGLNSSIILNIPKKCNIWRSGDSIFAYSGKFKILKYNGSSYDDITYLYPQTVSVFTNNGQWEKTISNLPAGQYDFRYGTDVRVDTEWYIEEVIDYKCLIQDGNNICKSDDGIQLITPDILPYTIYKFNNYGMDNLFNINSSIINRLNNDKFSVAILK